MAKRLGKFELPKRLIKLEETATDTYSSYIAEPFENGFGHTIGNSFRRILLSSIEGAAISSVKIEGVDHEFQSIEGVLEDVTEIVLNLKRVLLKSSISEPSILTIDVTKEGAVLAGDIQCDNNVKVINAKQLICTLTKKQRFHAELEVKVGRGFYVAEDNKKESHSIGVIPIDSLFSPVTKVSYAVEHTRVGKMTDFDKLILEVWTDGRITPDDALKDSAAILNHHISVFNTITDSEIEFETESKEVSEEQNKLRKLLNMSVNEIELSVRAANCLNNANITTVGELCMKNESEMLKYRNFGKKSLGEIKEILNKLGLSLGMKIDARLIDVSSSRSNIECTSS